MINNENPGFYSAHEIGHHLNMPVQRIYNLRIAFKFKRYKHPTPNKHNHWIYPMDLVRRLDELHKKGLTYKQIKRYLKENPKGCKNK